MHDRIATDRERNGKHEREGEEGEEREVRGGGENRRGRWLDGGREGVGGRERDKT